MWQNVKTAMLLAVLDGLLLAVGFFIGRGAGLVIAALFALAMNAFAYWNSDRLAIAAARGQEVGPQEFPELHRIVDDLCGQMNLPKPRVYICDDPSPNAFATGRNPNHAAICVTSGILQLVTARELRGVLAHELAHVRNRDILTTTMAATIAMAISFLAQMALWAMFWGGGRDGEGEGNALGILAVALLAAPAAAIIQLAISRSREYEADHTGARLSGDPLALASALRKLEARVKQVPMQVAPAISPLFIVNPFGNRHVSLAALFSTHPPLEDRIARLEHMAEGGAA
ncbi:MAG TPA: M48 family metalloprotease [Candidatus Dormibacteraeota bacterium]